MSNIYVNNIPYNKLDLIYNDAIKNNINNCFQIFLYAGIIV